MPTTSQPLPDNLYKPTIRTGTDAMVDAFPGIRPDRVFRHLQNGRNVCLRGSYPFAMHAYSWIRQQVRKRFPVQDYRSSRKHQKAWYNYASKLWIKVTDHRADLDKSPENWWIKEFYPGHGSFWITFSDFLGMNGARQWYEKGLHYPMLNHPIHPFYGTYFPTRTNHLALFDEWLAQAGSFGKGVDIGTGCGVLAHIMRKHGIKRIHATDTNPNAIYSVQLDCKRPVLAAEDQIVAEQADLFGSAVPGDGDLVVCNPPWIPGEPMQELDKGSYYPPGFFNRLFDGIEKKCTSGVTVALLFSDFALVCGLLDRHPIEERLKDHADKLALVEYHKHPAGEKQPKNKTWLGTIRAMEQVELFVITKK